MHRTPYRRGGKKFLPPPFPQPAFEARRPRPMGRGAKPQYENGRGLSSRAPFLGMFYGPFVNACSVARTLQRARVAGTGFKVPEPSAPSEGFLQTKDALPSG